MRSQSLSVPGIRASQGTQMSLIKGKTADKVETEKLKEHDATEQVKRTRNELEDSRQQDIRFKENANVVVKILVERSEDYSKFEVNAETGREDDYFFNEDEDSEMNHKENCKEKLEWEIEGVKRACMKEGYRKFEVIEKVGKDFYSPEWIKANKREEKYRKLANKLVKEVKSKFGFTEFGDVPKRNLDFAEMDMNELHKTLLEMEEIHKEAEAEVSRIRDKIHGQWRLK